MYITIPTRNFSCTLLLFTIITLCFLRYMVKLIQREKQLIMTASRRPTFAVSLKLSETSSHALLLTNSWGVHKLSAYTNQPYLTNLRITYICATCIKFMIHAYCMHIQLLWAVRTRQYHIVNTQTGCKCRQLSVSCPLLIATNCPWYAGQYIYATIVHFIRCMYQLTTAKFLDEQEMQDPLKYLST